MRLFRFLQAVRQLEEIMIDAECSVAYNVDEVEQERILRMKRDAEEFRYEE